MKFNDFLTEAATWDSDEATEFFEKLDTMLFDKRLAAYLKVTDDNYSTRTVAMLKRIQGDWKNLSDEFYGAEQFQTFRRNRLTAWWAWVIITPQTQAHKEPQMETTSSSIDFSSYSDDELLSFFSDFYKEINNIRPRGEYWTREIILAWCIEETSPEAMEQHQADWAEQEAMFQFYEVNDGKEPKESPFDSRFEEMAWNAGF